MSYHCSIYAIQAPSEGAEQAISFKPFKSQYHMTSMTGMTLEQWQNRPRRARRASRHRVDVFNEFLTL